MVIFRIGKCIVANLQEGNSFGGVVKKLKKLLNIIR